MKSTLVAAISLIAAIAAAGFGWYSHRALEAARIELADTTARLQKTEAALKPLEATVDALRKESAAQQQALEQARSETENVKAFLQAEKDAGLRVREELAKTRELLAAASKGRAPQGNMTSPGLSPAPAMLVRPAPVRVVPAGSGSAVGAAAPAR